MKQFFKMFFASLLAMIVSLVIIVGLVIGVAIHAGSSLSKSKNKKVGTAASILVLRTDARLHEQGMTNSLAGFSADVSSTAGLYETIEAIRAAKKDPTIKAIFLRLEGGTNGWATMEQVRAALLDFRTSGKKVIAYGEGISQRDYYLATAANNIYLNPIGNMELKGLASQSAFYKGTLDRLGVQPEIFYAGKFKSATEPFRAEKMSEPNKVQIAAVLHDVWASFLTAAATKAGTDTAAIQALAAGGSIQFAGDAVQAHLIDGAKYYDEVEDLMRPLVDKKADEKLPYISMNEYADHAEDSHQGSGRIAVLFAEGEIVDGPGTDGQIGSDAMVKTIREIRRNDKIKAVVMRVNSPGGSALASEVMWRELQLLRAKKPLIISMGDVAASGGYYIATAGDSLFAMPNTITGSIGVFSMMFNVGDAAKSKLGVTFDEVKTGPYADFPTATRALTAGEAVRMQSSVDTIYHTFKMRVSKGRRITEVNVDSIAQGRVWTGSDALGIGLVDGLGDLERALRSAAAKANLKDYEVQTYPEPTDQFKALLRKLSGNPLAATAVAMALQQQLHIQSGVLDDLQWMQRINGKVQMAMPMRISIN